MEHRCILRFTSLLILSLCLSEGIDGKKRYDGYQQWFVTPKTKQQVDLLRSFNDEIILFEDERATVNKQIEILISPYGIRKYGRQFHGMDFYVADENIQNYLDAEDERHRLKPDYLNYDPDDYNSLQDIYDEMERLASEECPAGFTCSVYSIGDSYEGRPIQALSVVSSGSHHTIWLDSLIHAREWLAGATLMRMTDQLLTGYGDDTDATHLLDNYDFYIVPVMNPDGYQYSWDYDRFWRKSRNPNEDSTCIGTDLNRNYPTIFWGEQGASSNPCSDNYHGAAPNSESETQAVVNETLRLNADGRVIIWISYHTTAELWLIPYGGTDSPFTCNKPDGYEDMLQAGEAAVEAIEAVSGNNWIADNACEGLYAASGITIDFAVDSDIGAGVKYSYTPELRGPGFNPPPTSIDPSFAENYAGLVALVYEVESIEGF